MNFTFINRKFVRKGLPLLQLLLLLIFPSIFPFGENQGLSKEGQSVSSGSEKISASDQLPPLDVQNESSEYITRKELEGKIADLSWKKGKFKITPYGFLNAALSYDSARTLPGEFTLYAQSADIDDSPDFAIDARTSRIGLMVDAPGLESLPGSTLRGVVEFDFQGVCSGTRNRGGLLLRKAFAELAHKEQDWKLAFGQDWEIISPLYPQMLVYLPAGFAGNIGYRRCQFRAEKGLTFTQNFKTILQASVNDDFSTDYASTSGVSIGTTGMPVFEGRVAFKMLEEARRGLPITLGISGHTGKQCYSFSKINSCLFAEEIKGQKIPTWSGNFDFDLPLTRKFRLQGEYYYGENLNGFCGGIAQGIDLYRRDGIRDQGCWISGHVDWTSKFSTNTGYSIDLPEKDDLIGVVLPTNGITYARTKNAVVFTNFLYNWTPALMTGLELSYWKTDYRKADITGESPVFLPMRSGEAFRTECVVRFTF
ncbi:MAG: hypothetical protein Q4G69_13630 [Planctomycetia bacterium]|nr:hypothetical protein [Planctomycetia bacterium]